MKTVHLLLLAILIASTLIGCGYNDIQRQDESVKAAWSEVINQYQRRADLVPNLVNALKVYIQHEERVFVEVTNARAKVGSIQVNTDSLKDSQTLQTFQSVQGELSTALSRLMIVSERYPDLKADGLFQNLQAQLEGTENRITVTRNRYVQTIQQYNSSIRVFPNNLTAMMFDYEVKPNFKVENENAISTAPTVEFGSN